MTSNAVLIEYGLDLSAEVVPGDLRQRGVIGRSREPRLNPRWIAPQRERELTIGHGAVGVLVTANAGPVLPRLKGHPGAHRLNREAMLI